MQTFLPYASVIDSLRCLDYRRLGKQRVEAKQMIDALEGRSQGWRHHAATKMWEGHIDALKVYYNASLYVWEVERGYVNNMPRLAVGELPIFPKWFGDPKFHASHRSNLLRKKPDFYSKYGWKEPHDLPYVWPTP